MSASTPSLGTAPTVLIVDDEPLVRRVMTAALSQRYTVHSAADAHEALAVWPSIQDRVHLLVTDLRMPGLSGTDLARELRTWQNDVPVLYVSGFTDAFDGWKLNRREQFLVKPFSGSQLKAAVGSLLGHKLPPCSQCGERAFKTTHIEDDGTSVVATCVCAKCGAETHSTVNRAPNTGLNRCHIDDGPLLPTGYGFVGPQGFLLNATCRSCNTSVQTRSPGISAIPW